MRIGWVGKEPLELAIQVWGASLFFGTSLAMVAIPVLTVLFCYLYGAIVLSPKRTNQLAGQYGYLFSAEAFKKEALKILLLTALVLVVVFYQPGLVRRFILNSRSVSFAVGGTGVLLLVGVFFDLLKQLEFLKRKRESGIPDWKLCYTAMDEMEAALKAGFLGEKGIPALVEPLRFTWGMPIRTAVDQYRIYTPIENCHSGRELILGAEKTV